MMAVTFIIHKHMRFVCIQMFCTLLNHISFNGAQHSLTTHLISSFVADLRHRCRTGTKRLRQGLPAAMGEAHHSQVSRRARAGLHQVLEGRHGVQCHHSQEQAGSAGLAESQGAARQGEDGNGLLRGREGIRCHEAAGSRR